MAQNERLTTLKNVSDSDIREVWDSVGYTFAPGEEKTLAHGLAVVLRERQPAALQVTSESTGVAPSAVVTEVRLTLKGEHPLVVFWDGRGYQFEPGKPTIVDASIAPVLITQARAVSNPLYPRGATLEFAAAEAPVNPEPTTPEPVEPALEPKPKRKSRKNTPA